MTDLKGTGVALATPMKSNYSVDFDGLEKLIEHTITGDVDYLVVMGTTGESPVFSWKEKLELLRFTSKVSNGRKPIVFGLGGNNTFDLVEKSKQLSNFNLAAILSVSPYYNRPSQEGIFRHYSLLADASPWPLILYNVPSRTASNIEASTTIRLSSHENIIAMKEASGNLMQAEEIQKEMDSEFLLLSGDDSLALDIIKLGGDGVISDAANIVPAAFSIMIKEMLQGNPDKAQKSNAGLQHVYELLSKEGNPSSLKAGLEFLNIGTRVVKPPLYDASDLLVQEWKEYFDSLE